MTGPQLRVARVDLGLTQAELGKLLDVPSNTIARWERGKMEIQHPTILRLALQQLHTKKERPTP